MADKRKGTWQATATLKIINLLVVFFYVVAFAFKTNCIN
jgi:hypothetical protein